MGTAKGAARPEATQQAMLLRCRDDLRDSLAGDHCYEDVLSTKRTPKSAAAKRVLPAQLEEAKQSCVPSAIHGLVHRLNGTQGLVSTTMRFDAGAASRVRDGFPVLSSESGSDR